MSANLKSQKCVKRRKSLYEGDYAEFTRTVLPEIYQYIEAFLEDISNFLPVWLYGAATLRHDKATAFRRLDHEGLSFATLTLPKLWAGLSAYLETGQVHYPSFVLDGNSGHPVFLRGLFRLAYGYTAYKGTAIMLIYQLSVMFSKLRGPYPNSVLSKQLGDFVKVDEWLSTLDHTDAVNQPITDTARFEIERLFSDFDVQESIPRPGPGATNTPVAKHLRYRPHVLYTQIDDVLPYHDWFYVNGWDHVNQTKYLLTLHANREFEPRARFKFVHKKVGKARGICIEQNEMQFLQQAFKHSLYQWIERHPLTRGRVNFSDQSINARLALEASKDCTLATIDMSEASDRIARQLVLYLFRNTVLGPYLDALSTRWIDLPQDLLAEGSPDSLRCSKFAPMGSGLCFPIMSIVHWALIRAIIKRSMLPEELTEKVYVYGDDIILPCECIEAVYTYLPRYGMKLNKDKSFYRSQFRESCGVHAYDGMDITPTYVKYVPIEKNVTQVMSCINVEFQFYKRNFTNVARVFRENISRLYPNLPITPYTSPEFGFKREGSFEPVRQVAAKRKKDQWGEPTDRVRVVRPIQSKDLPPTEYECYLRHVLTKNNTRFMGGEPSGYKTAWRNCRLPQLHGVPYPNWISEQFNFIEDDNEPSHYGVETPTIPVRD